MHQDSGPRACEKRHAQIHAKDLPACCPPRDARAWDAHPRVYLELDERNVAHCPYCSASYQLVG